MIRLPTDIPLFMFDMFENEIGKMQVKREGLTCIIAIVHTEYGITSTNK